MLQLATQSREIWEHPEDKNHLFLTSDLVVYLIIDFVSLERPHWFQQMRIITPQLLFFDKGAKISLFYDS
jgi:hypothetical protein